jgi:hypothetical protein
MTNSAIPKADQTPGDAIRLPSAQALMDHIASQPGLSARSSALLEAMRMAVVTDPSAGGIDRLRHLVAGLWAEIERQGIRPIEGSAGETIPGVTKGIDASDQYFLVIRDDGGDPVETLLEALVVSAAGVLDDILEQGSTLTDLERCSLLFPLILAGGLLDDAVSPIR